MTSRRIAKVASAVRETVSTAILFEVRDPRVKNVTVTRVEVSGDLRSAKVYVSVMGDQKVQALTMHGLNAARGFLQSKVAARLQTKHTPILTFVLDPGVKLSVATSALLREVLDDSPARSEQEDEAEAGDDLEGAEPPEAEDEGEAVSGPPDAEAVQPGSGHSHADVEADDRDTLEDTRT